MMKQIYCPEAITRNLLPPPQSRRARWVNFWGRDRKLRLDVEQILKTRKRADVYFRWKNRGVGAFAFLCELKHTVRSSTSYFFPEDEFSVIAKAYGVFAPELYEILHDSFFRKTPRYKSSCSELYLGVPKGIHSMTLGELVHHLKLLKKIREERDGFED